MILWLDDLARCAELLVHALWGSRSLSAANALAAGPMPLAVWWCDVVCRACINCQTRALVVEFDVRRSNVRFDLDLTLEFRFEHITQLSTALSKLGDDISSARLFVIRK